MYIMMKVFLLTNLVSHCRSLRTSAVSVLSWNVNGLRSLLKHDPEGIVLKTMIIQKNPDFICLQETKLQETDAIEAKLLELLAEYQVKCYWSSSKARKGYSGTAILCIGDRYKDVEGNYFYYDIKVSYNGVC